MAAMKAMMQMPAKESKEKEAHIKLLEEKLTKLTRKLEKHPTQSVTKDLESEEEVKASFHSEAFDDEVHLKKGDKLKNY